jgi:putative acetyltransferase
LLAEELKISLAATEDIPIIRELWQEYWRSVGLAPGFQNFADEVESLPGEYTPPSGRLLLARVGGREVGTAAFRRLNDRACEAKRLYVRPEFRERGIAKALLRELIDQARRAGYRDMFGDTLKSMTPALKMYQDIGFTEIGPYSSNPTPGAIFLRLALEC